MKWTVVVLGTIVMALVFVVEKLGSVFQIGISVLGLANGTFLGIFTVGMTSRTANSKVTQFTNFLRTKIKSRFFLPYRG